MFVGGRGAGKGLHARPGHVTAGAQYTGYKLLATWAPGSISTKLHDTMLDSVFTPPLKHQLDALRQASRSYSLRPGDVFLLSGGVAHVTFTVGSDELNLTAYESVVTLKLATSVAALLPRRRPQGVNTLLKRWHAAARARGLQGLDDRRVGSPGHRAQSRLRTARFPVTDADAAALRACCATTSAATIELLDEEDRFYRKHVPQRLLAFLRRATPLSVAGPSEYWRLPLPAVAAPLLVKIKFCAG